MHYSGDSRLTAIAKRRVKPVDRMLAWQESTALFGTNNNAKAKC